VAVRARYERYRTESEKRESGRAEDDRRMGSNHKAIRQGDVEIWSIRDVVANRGRRILGV
jgi:hypothetical protein